MNAASDTAPDVEGTSDVIYDSPCRPCADEDKNTEGLVVCFQCQTCFCSTCIGHHNKCFKTHSLFYKTTEKPQIVQQLQPSDLLCDKHPGTAINMYCGEHDVVSCAVCIAIDHRLCKLVDYIPKLTKEVLKGRKKDDVKTSLKRVTDELKTLKASKIEEISKVTSEMDAAVNEVRNMSERLVARIKSMEESDVSKIQTQHASDVAQIKDGIKGLDFMSKNVENHIDKITQYKGDNEAKMFVLLNKALEIESECRQQIEGYTYSIQRKSYASFKVNDELETGLNKIDSLCFNAECTETGVNIGSPNVSGVNLGAQCVPGVSCIGEHEVKLAVQQTRLYQITDICLLHDGCLVLADRANNILIRLDQTYRVRDCLCISLSEGICIISTDELAALNQDCVQVIYLGRSMVKTKSFNVSKNDNSKVKMNSDIEGYRFDQINLRRFVFKEGKLYIVASCHHRKRGEYLYIEYVVLVYNVSGTHLQTIFPDFKADTVGDIRQISLSLNRSHLSFATSKSGIVTINSDGSLLSTFTDYRLEGNLSFTSGDNGQMYVCGFRSENVLLVDIDGTVVEEVLGRYDGISSPSCIMYIKASKRLLVFCQDVSALRVFQIS